MRQVGKVVQVQGLISSVFVGDICSSGIFLALIFIFENIMLNIVFISNTEFFGASLNFMPVVHSSPALL